MKLIDRILVKVIGASHVARTFAAAVESLTHDVQRLAHHLAVVINNQQRHEAMIAELAARNGLVIRTVPVDEPPTNPKDKPN